MNELLLVKMAAVLNAHPEAKCETANLSNTAKIDKMNPVNMTKTAIILKPRTVSRP